MLQPALEHLQRWPRHSVKSHPTQPSLESCTVLVQLCAGAQELPELCRVLALSSQLKHLHTPGSSTRDHSTSQLVPPDPSLSLGSQCLQTHPWVGLQPLSSACQRHHCIPDPGAARSLPEAMVAPQAPLQPAVTSWAIGLPWTAPALSGNSKGTAAQLRTPPRQFSYWSEQCALLSNFRGLVIVSLEEHSSLKSWAFVGCWVILSFRTWGELAAGQKTRNTS